MTDPFVGPNERQPGEFRRKGKDGPPIVSDPERTRQPTGRKEELKDKCKARGIPLPDKITVKELIELLGTEPADATYSRASGFGSIVDNSWGLEKWREQRLLIGAHEHVDILATIDVDDKDALNRLAEQCHDTAKTSLAADRGTHVHKLTELADLDEPYADLIDYGDLILGIPASLQHRIVAQWIRFRRALGISAVHVEMPVVNDEWRCAGTLDRIDVADRDIVTPITTIPAGQHFVGDIKTGSDVIKPKYAVQLVAYADAVPYDTQTETRLEW